MARQGNFDVTYNLQGWFDTTLADPLNGWFVDDAIGGPPAQPKTAAHGGWVTRAPRPPVESIPFEIVDPDRIAANDNGFSADPKVHVLDRFGPMRTLPETEFLVAGPVKEQSPWKWIAIGAAVGVGAMLLMNQKKPAKKTASRR